MTSTQHRRTTDDVTTKVNDSSGNLIIKVADGPKFTCYPDGRVRISTPWQGWIGPGTTVRRDGGDYVLYPADITPADAVHHDHAAYRKGHLIDVADDDD